MPQVQMADGSTHRFPYTREGIAAANAARKERMLHATRPRRYVESARATLNRLGGGA